MSWQGATTLRPHGREEKQRRQRAVARLNRARSAFTQQVKRIVGTFASIHAAYPAEQSGQLPFLGSKWLVLACAHRKRGDAQRDSTDVMANNGGIHVIDTVLMPN